MRREEGEKGKAGQEVKKRDVSRVAAERAYTPNQIPPSPHSIPYSFTSLLP